MDFVSQLQMLALLLATGVLGALAARVFEPAVRRRRARKAWRRAGKAMDARLGR